MIKLKEMHSELSVDNVKKTNHMVLIMVIISFITIPISYILNMLIIKPTDVLDTEKIKNTYIQPIDTFMPESHEFKRLIFYIVLICIFSLVLTLLYKRFHNHISDTAIEVAGLILLFLSCAVAIFTLFHSFNFQSPDFQNLDGGFYTRLLSITTNPLRTLIVLENVFFAYYIYKKLKIRYPKIKYVMYMFDIVIIIVCVFVAREAVFVNMDNNFFNHHLSVVYNPIYELASERTPGVDFQCLYGLNCYWFYYIEMFFLGHVSVNATAWLMGVLMCVITVFWYFGTYRMSKNRAVAFMSAVGLITFCALIPMLYTASPYFQYFPLRAIGPVSVLFFIIMFHTSKIKKARVVYFIFAAIAATFGVLWNPETGLIASLALVAYFAYDSFSLFGTLKSKGLWVRMGKAMAVIAVSFTVAIAILEIITKVRTGQFLDFAGIFWGIKVFMGEGFYMLPLPDIMLAQEISIHPYVIVLGIYSMTVIYTIFALFSKTKPSKEYSANALGFASAVLGFGLFTYYLGRSHVYCFSFCIWPAFFCALFLAYKCLYFCKRHFESYKIGESKIRQMVVPAICGFMSATAFFSIFVCAVTFYTIRSTEDYMEYKKNEGNISEGYNSDRDFIEKYKTDSMMILDNGSMYYLSDLGLKNEYIGPARVDYFFIEDYYNEMEQVKGFKGRLFMKQHVRFGYFVFPDGETYAQKYDKITSEHFVLLDSNDKWLVYESIE